MDEEQRRPAMEPWPSKRCSKNCRKPAQNASNSSLRFLAVAAFLIRCAGTKRARKAWASATWKLRWQCSPKSASQLFPRKLGRIAVKESFFKLQRANRSSQIYRGLMEINREMLLQSFRDETEELLGQMEQSLLLLESRPDDRGVISSIFRAAHTLKGNASLLEFTSATHALHSLEDLLDLARNGAIQVSSELINLLLQSVDITRQIAKRLLAGEDSLLPEHQQFFSRMGQIARDLSSAKAAAPSEVGASSESAPIQRAKGASSLRVDVARLDRMLNLTVEFAIAQGRMRRMLQERMSVPTGSSEVLDTHANLESLFLELQELVMKIRMVPVGPTF